MLVCHSRGKTEPVLKRLSGDCATGNDPFFFGGLIDGNGKTAADYKARNLIVKLAEITSTADKSPDVIPMIAYEDGFAAKRPVSIDSYLVSSVHI